jgi:Na+-transporting NADH:ubiquinone oxidoreductase subunit NqrF
MPVLDQLTQSNLSLDGTRGFTTRNFGFIPAPSPISSADATALHRNYSILNNPKNVKVLDFNGTFVTPPPSSLDETDTNAPFNTAAGAAGSVVSQIYKSSTGQNYKDKGPVGGKY